MLILPWRCSRRSNTSLSCHFKYQVNQPSLSHIILLLFDSKFCPITHLIYYVIRWTCTSRYNNNDIIIVHCSDIVCAVLEISSSLLCMLKVVSIYICMQKSVWTLLCIGWVALHTVIILILCIRMSLGRGSSPHVQYVYHWINMSLLWQLYRLLETNYSICCPHGTSFWGDTQNSSSSDSCQ